MTKASKFATAIAAIASPAIATVEELSAAPLTVGANRLWRPRRPKWSIGTYFDDDYKSVSKVQ